MIDLASETDYSSDTDTARDGGHVKLVYLKVNKLRNKIHIVMKKYIYKKAETHTRTHAGTHAH